MTNYEINKIRDMKNHGVKVRDIAKRLGCSVASVHTYARDIPSHHSENTPISDETIRFIKQARLSGVSIRETAEKAGVCVSTVQRHTSGQVRAKKHTSQSKARTRERWQQAIAMRELGMSFDQIARRLGCTPQSVPVMICRHKNKGA